MKPSPSVADRGHCRGSRIEPLEARIAPAAVASINLADLNGSNGFKLPGVTTNDHTGQSVSIAGDVNGDGFADLLIGAPYADPNGTDSGAAFVVFGKAGGFEAPFAFSSLDGSNGFKLNGVAAGDRAGLSTSPAGDVNGDGFADLLVGASYADPNGNSSGTSYVVFGKAAGFGAALDLSSLDGSNGFKLQGTATYDLSGHSVSAAGDVNGDGFGDIIVGAEGDDTAGNYAGASYVIFGKPSGFGVALNLSSLDGSNGFKLIGEAAEDLSGRAVSGAGDVNGDGFADLLIGAERSNSNGDQSGSSYVVFGKAGGFGAVLALSSLNGVSGFKILGEAEYDLSGRSVSAAGDVNGDGFDDLLIGAPLGDRYANYPGASYVIFGKAGGFGATLGLASLDGSNGFKLQGAEQDDSFGYSMSAAGDVNGDGFADLIIGAKGADSNGRRAGAAYVIFGKTNGFLQTLNVSDIDGVNGFKILAESDGDCGRSVSGVGDVDGDGFADVLLGAPFSDQNSGYTGAAYVIFGFGSADVAVAVNGKSATFRDWDGDAVMIKSTKGPLDAAQFRLSSPNPITGGSHLVYADFSAAAFVKASITFTAKRGTAGGDGLVNIGTLDARGVALGKVSIDGDLQQIDAAGVAALSVYSLGQFADAKVHGAPLASTIDGNLGALTVKTAASRVTIAAQTIGAIKALNLDGVKILAAGVLNPAKLANAMAIKSLTVSGSVRDSQILAGYDAAGAAVNGDVQIGAVKVFGQWVASDLVAGARSGADGIFATADDTLVPGGNAIVSKIASITIAGAAFGTGDNLRDGFGFVAEEIGGVSIGKAKLPLAKGARNDLAPLLAGLAGDLRAREVGV